MFQALTDELQRLNVFTNKDKINPQSWRILSKYPTLLAKIESSTSFLTVDTSIRTRLYCVKNAIIQQPTCKVCGVDMAFNKQTNQFNTYCPNIQGKSCAVLDESLVQQRKTTMERKYGEKPFANSEIVERRRATLIDRYGVDAPMKSEEIRNRTADTLRARYGVSDISSIPGTAAKRAATNTKRYGRSTFAESQVPDETIGLLSDKDWLESRLRDFCLAEIAEELNTTQYTIRKYVYSHGLQERVAVKSSSSMHRELMRMLDQHGVEYLSNHKKLIAPKEVDLFIPSANLAIEFNGVFYHSELSGRTKSYHLDKTTNCANAGVRLIHVWSNEWDTQNDIVRSRILNAVGVATESVYARKCEIVVLSKDAEKAFFNTNHIQGHRPSTICYGLSYNGKIVAACNFIKSRFDKKVEWELLRYANAINTHVVGGGSKLFRRFIRDYSPTSVISYCDRRWGTGGLYTSLGFTYQHSSVPNYFYFKRNGDTNKLLSRQNFQKHKLCDVLETFDPLASEWENMKNNGYDRIWDCGNMVFLWLPTA